MEHPPYKTVKQFPTHHMAIIYMYDNKDDQDFAMELAYSSKAYREALIDHYYRKIRENMDFLQIPQPNHFLNQIRYNPPTARTIYENAKRRREVARRALEAYNSPSRNTSGPLFLSKNPPKFQSNQRKPKKKGSTSRRTVSLSRKTKSRRQPSAMKILKKLIYKKHPYLEKSSPEKNARNTNAGHFTQAYL